MKQEDKELIFGYDRIDAITVNRSEAEVVKYVYSRMFELNENPPKELIQEVIDEYAKFGETLSPEDAKTKIPLSKILMIIEEEAAKKWPAEYKHLSEKHNHNVAIYTRKMTKNKPSFTEEKVEIEPIVSRELWDKVQLRIAENKKQGIETADYSSR